MEKDVLIKIHDAARGGFTTVARLRLRCLALNGEIVIHPKQWDEPIKRASVAGRGLFKDAASDELMRANFFDGAVKDYKFVIPGDGTLSGPFQIVSLEFAGEHNGEVHFDLALEAAGQCHFEKEQAAAKT